MIELYQWVTPRGHQGALFPAEAALSGRPIPPRPRAHAPARAVGAALATGPRGR